MSCERVPASCSEGSRSDSLRSTRARWSGADAPLLWLSLLCTDAHLPYRP